MSGFKSPAAPVDLAEADFLDRVVPALEIFDADDDCEDACSDEV